MQDLQTDLQRLLLAMVSAKTTKQRLTVQVGLTLLGVRATQELPVSIPLEVVVKIMMECFSMHQRASDSSEKALIMSMTKLWYAMSNLQEFPISARVNILTSPRAEFLQVLRTIPDLETMAKSYLQ
jgi:hypothetical protein